MPEDFKIEENLLQPVNGSGNRRLATLGFIIVLLTIGFFGYKVFSYYRQIQNGTFDASSLTFQSSEATQARLVSIAKAAPGSGQLATTDDPSTGPADARVTIVQFADFGCPYSEQESYVVTAIAKQYPNDVRVIYRDFPLVDIHPGADLAAEAGACAEEQGKFWEYHDILFRNSGEFTQEALVDYANLAGLSVGSFSKCLDSRKYTDEVAQDLADGVAAGVTGTPTFFINGEKIDGAVPFSTFKDIVEAFLVN